MFRKYIPFIIFIMIVGFSLSAASEKKEKFSFVVAKDVVNKLRSNFKSLNSYVADFEIKSTDGKKTSVRRGKIQFRKPDKVHLAFSYPEAQVVIANGEKVWIYLPYMKLLGEQSLKKSDKDGFFRDATPVGLDRLFSLYHYSFQKGDQPKTLNLNGQTASFYVLDLKQKVITSGFRSMEVWVDAQHRVRRVVAENASGKSVTMTFQNIETGKDLDDSLFVFDKKQYKIKSVVQDPLVQP